METEKEGQQVEMNNKKKVLLFCAFVWIIVFAGYMIKNPDSLHVTQATQYNSGGFKAISNMATGYFNESEKQLSHMPKMLP